MKTSITWNRDEETVSNEDHCKCELGVSRKTGRLQWCPGCNCWKILFILPGIMLPIILMFILLARLNGAAYISPRGISNLSYDYENEILDQTNDSEFARDVRCTSVRYAMSETADAEERELLKDVRTSFIPPELVVVPPNCLKPDELTVPAVQSNAAADDTFYYEFIARHRRSFPTRENTSAATGDIYKDILEGESDETSPPRVPWKILPDEEETHNQGEEAVFEETDVGQEVTVNAVEPIGFHTFWKSSGSRESIRDSQAAIMKQYMDTTADPCVDFYQFACGNWATLNPIPKDKAGYDTFEMLRESLDTVLRNLLSEDIRSPVQPVNNEIESTTKVDIAFQSHLSTTESPNRYAEDLGNTLDSLQMRKQIIKKRSVLDHILRRYTKLKALRRRRQLTSRRHSNPEIDAEIKAKYLFASCMNSELLEKRGIEPLLSLLKELGGWPVLEPGWRSENFGWLNLTALLRTYNNDIFIVEWVGPDIKNSDENIIQFDQTGLGLPTRDYFLHESNTQYLDAYRNFMKTIMTILGAAEDRAMKASNQVVAFEKELAKITSSSEERVNVSVLYKRMTLTQLHSQVPQIDWQWYLSVVQHRNVQSSETVVIYALDYMKNLVSLLGRTESNTIANYLLWRFVRHRVNNLDDRFQDAKQKFFHALFGREQSPPRWKNCVGQVNSNMGMALGAMFVRRYFDENSKEDTLQMTHELQQSFREILNTTDWLDTSTKHLAEMKVNSMSLKIGYPDFILSRKELNKKYEGLEMHPDKYFENTLNVLKHVTRTEQIKINEKVNKTIWQTAPAIVNAYYSRNKNQIMFPAGILQPPFYHRHFPRSLNFGGIGVVIGHELTHGFDDKGRLFDRDGNIHKWWSDNAITGFHERAKCLISQYGNYTVSEVGLPIDGESTQGENIADNGGIRQAFYAYRNWLAKNDGNDLAESETLPGINLNGRQLFFLNFAQVWCGAMRPEATRNKLKTAVHSPGKFRVIGTLSNSIDFAREFNCPTGSPMSPAHKCSVW